MKIEVGTKFLIEFPGTTEKMPTFLVGFEKDGYFIVKIPPIPGIRGRLREGNRVVCRFLHQGAIVSFRTEVLMMAQKPAPLLFLTYPFGFESHLVRQHQRVNCYFPAQALVQECRFPGLIMDISSGGCRIVCDDGSDKLPCPLSAGQDIAIEFHLLDRTRRYVLTGLHRHQLRRSRRAHGRGPRPAPVLPGRRAGSPAGPPPLMRLRP
jgi:c-di-GMP-binding flagellar brake protein YcgR